MISANQSSQLYTLFILYFFSCIFTNATANLKEPLRHISSKQCKTCHEQIYSQWNRSMHANSTALKDPIHGSFYEAVVGSPVQEDIKKNGKYPVCLQCHSPTAAKDGKTNLATLQVYNEGVNCISCHTITRFKGTKNADGSLRLGMQAYEFSDTSLQGPGINHTDQNWQHPLFQNTGNPEIMKTNAICMGCHDQRNNSNKIALCQTGAEISSSEGSNNCLSCHMPIVDGKADHSFLGGHSAKMVSKGLLMTVTAVSKNSSTLEVSIKLANQLPHNLPTGAPFRNIYVKLIGYDSEGQEIWMSSQSHPAKDDKQAMFMYSLGDENGNPAPPPKATQVLKDTRLKPHETRELIYSLPKDKIVKLRATAYYDLLLPPMKKKFSKPEHKVLVTPKVIAITEHNVE